MGHRKGSGREMCRDKYQKPDTIVLTSLKIEGGKNNFQKVANDEDHRHGWENYYQ